MPLFVTHEPAFRTSLQTMLRTTVSPRIGSKSLCLLSPIYLVSSCCKESTFRTSSSKFRPRGNLGYQSYRYHMQNLWIRLRRVGHAVKQSTFHLGWFRLAQLASTSTVKGVGFHHLILQAPTSVSASFRGSWFPAPHNQLASASTLSMGLVFTTHHSGTASVETLC